MIYQIGKLVIGDDWKQMRSWWGRYISKSKKWLTGVLTYNSEERCLYFFESRLTGEEEIFAFDIDTTQFELVRRGKMTYHFFVQIKDKNNKEFLFDSDISFYGRSQADLAYAQAKQIVYNQNIINIINHLKKKSNLSFK
ncbi:MAG: hypothetical protein ACFFEN_01350 [Candidatus Thorarchaeota archaeon]